MYNNEYFITIEDMAHWKGFCRGYLLSKCPGYRIGDVYFIKIEDVNKLSCYDMTEKVKNLKSKWKISRLSRLSRLERFVHTV